LIRRVINALDVARRMVRAIDERASFDAANGSRTESADGLLRGKVVAETAMFLLCLQPILNLDERIRERVEVLANLLIPLARNSDVLAAICLDPGLAGDHAVAHAILSRLGFPDTDVDELLSVSLSIAPDFGPERLPHRVLEQAWLARVWGVFRPPTRRESTLVASSMLGRPLDALGATRLDIYAFTHALMYASDLGTRRIATTRSKAAIAADADAALAQSLDSNDFDLTAEVIMTWPMLGSRWSATATFAFGIIAEVEDSVGFLPGLTFDSTRYHAHTGDDRSRFALGTSYHTAYVMGYLCAVALREGCAPPAAVPPARRSRGAGAALVRLVTSESPASCWEDPINALAPRQQDAVASLLLTILFRRARIRGDLALVRHALEIALAFNLIDGPAPRQAAALLRRSTALQL